ncbi:MAG: hypothetical protein K6G40_05135 [Eubacterium sp.]|nr:hypothetical protein [Eubacterium sp.]
MKKRLIVFIIAAVIIVAGALGAFYYSINNTADIEADTEVTELDELLTQNFDLVYPASPRAVVNEYSRYLVALYNEDYTEEEFNTLTDQMRCLMDDELLEENPLESYRAAMKAEADEYKSKSWTVNNYTISAADEVKYTQFRGYDCALVTVSYFIKQDTSYARTVQDYVFRQDEDNRWKIMGYSLHIEDDAEEETDESVNE